MRFENSLAKLLKDELSRSETQMSGTPDFFTSAVKTARASSKTTRSKIMADIAEALTCNVDDLMFLFDDGLPQNDNVEQTAVPNFRETMFLEAAE